MSLSFRPLALLGLLTAAALATACARQDAASPDPATPAATDAGEVNLYTTREPGLIQPLLDAFTTQTGVKVNTVFVRDGLPERLRAEGERSPADVLMTVDSGNLLDLVEGGFSQPAQFGEVGRFVVGGGGHAVGSLGACRMRQMLSAYTHP